MEMASMAQTAQFNQILHLNESHMAHIPLNLSYQCSCLNVLWTLPLYVSASTAYCGISYHMCNSLCDNPAPRVLLYSSPSPWTYAFSSSRFLYSWPKTLTIHLVWASPGFSVWPKDYPLFSSTPSKMTPDHPAIPITKYFLFWICVFVSWSWNQVQCSV